MKTIAMLMLGAVAAFSADPAPELRAWVMSAWPNAIAPDVHSVRTDDRFVYVESAGLSLHSFGPLEANQYDVRLGPRAWSFRFPRNPKPAEIHLSTPGGVIGVFATAVPIYNPTGTVSYRDQNIWHEDAVAATRTRSSPLLAALTRETDRHSPILGFALDGYPIYGPFGWDGSGSVHRMKSSYRLRNISRRAILPDGTILTPAQAGPDVSLEFPLGRFAEDYEYVAGSGDLDEFNGRFARTPDYPRGTYAYFLSTGDQGAPAWPYTIGPHYFGDAPLDAPARVRKVCAIDQAVELWTDRTIISAGEPVHLTLVFRDPAGRPIRFLEKVHQQPVHLVVVSNDLAEFDHIHPEPVPGDALSVSHAFRHGGKYWLYADYTAPGAGPTVARFAIDIKGEKRTPVRLLPDDSLQTADGVTVKFTTPPILKSPRRSEARLHADRFHRPAGRRSDALAGSMGAYHDRQPGPCKLHPRSSDRERRKQSAGAYPRRAGRRAESFDHSDRHRLPSSGRLQVMVSVRETRQAGDHVLGASRIDAGPRKFERRAAGRRAIDSGEQRWLRTAHPFDSRGRSDADLGDSRRRAELRQ